MPSHRDQDLFLGGKQHSKDLTHLCSVPWLQIQAVFTHPLLCHRREQTGLHHAEQPLPFVRLNSPFLHPSPTIVGSTPTHQRPSPGGKLSFRLPCQYFLHESAEHLSFPFTLCGLEFPALRCSLGKTQSVT